MKKKDEIILEIADVNFPNKAYGYYEDGSDPFWRYR